MQPPLLCLLLGAPSPFPVRTSYVHAPLEGLLASLSTLLCESGAKWNNVPFSCFTREAASVEKCYVDSRSRYNDLYRLLLASLRRLRERLSFTA